MFLPLKDSVIVLYFVTYCPFLFCDYLDGEERERELAALLSLSSWCLLRDCFVAIPHSAMDLSAVCDCDTHYFGVSFMRTAMALASMHICLV